jgi:hypothetical protein
MSEESQTPEEDEDRPRPRRRGEKSRSERDDEDDERRPVHRSRRRDEDDEDEERRPRRRSRRPGYREYEDDDDDDLDTPDGTGGLIPYKNPKALSAYSCGVFALSPCVGLILGPIALILGFMGMKHNKQYPKSGGKGHAIAGIVLGSLMCLLNYGVIVFGVVAGVVGSMK